MWAVKQCDSNVEIRNKIHLKQRINKCNHQPSQTFKGANDYDNKNYFNKEKEKFINAWQEIIIQQKTINQTTLLVEVKFTTMTLMDMYQWKIWQNELFQIGSLMRNVGSLRKIIWRLIRNNSTIFKIIVFNVA